MWVFAQFVIFYTKSHAGTFELAERAFGSSIYLPRVATRVSPFFACQESQPATLVAWIALPSALKHGHSVDVFIQCQYVTTATEMQVERKGFCSLCGYKKCSNRNDSSSSCSLCSRPSVQAIASWWLEDRICGHAENSVYCATMNGVFVRLKDRKVMHLGRSSECCTAQSMTCSTVAVTRVVPFSRVWFTFYYSYSLRNMEVSRGEWA